MQSGMNMKIIKQLMIIITVSFIAEVLHALIPLPVASSVYGLVIMFLLLATKMIKVEQVEEVSGFFMLIMPVLFISPSVSIITAAADVGNSFVAVIVIALVSTIVVTAVTGFVSQTIVRGKKGGTKK